MFRTRLVSATTRLAAVAAVAALGFTAPPQELEAQHSTNPHAAAANFDLAARWAPYQIRDLIHSTAVSPVPSTRLGFSRETTSFAVRRVGRVVHSSVTSTTNCQ